MFYIINTPPQNSLPPPENPKNDDNRNPGKNTVDHGDLYRNTLRCSTIGAIRKPPLPYTNNRCSNIRNLYNNRPKNTESIL
jgi:hypothetical protein